MQDRKVLKVVSVGELRCFRPIEADAGQAGRRNATAVRPGRRTCECYEIIQSEFGRLLRSNENGWTPVGG